MTRRVELEAAVALAKVALLPLYEAYQTLVAEDHAISLVDFLVDSKMIPSRNRDTILALVSRNRRDTTTTLAEHDVCAVYIEAASALFEYDLKNSIGIRYTTGNMVIMTFSHQ